MTVINVYNDDADAIEEIADRNGLTTAEVIQALCEHIDECLAENEWS